MATSIPPRDSHAVPRPRRPGALAAPGSAGVTIERAKGLLMFRHGLNSHQAFALLLERAHLLGTDVAGSARRIVDDALGGPPARSEESHVRWMSAVAEASAALYAGQPGPPALDRILATAVRTTGAELGLVVALRRDRPGTLQLQASCGFPGMHGGGGLPRREPWMGVMATGVPSRWTGRLDAAELSRRVDAVVVPFAPEPGESGAMLVARRADVDHLWPGDDVPGLLAAFARLASPAVATPEVPADTGR